MTNRGSSLSIFQAAITFPFLLFLRFISRAGEPEDAKLRNEFDGDVVLTPLRPPPRLDST